MKRIFKSFLLFFLFCFSPNIPVSAAEQVPEQKQATQAALIFLELLDQGEYGRCWDHSSSFFQQKIERQKWVQDVAHMRPQYGKNQKRVLQFSKPVTETAGGSDQPMYFLLFRSTFSEKSVAEMVTMTKENNGHWRVAGYSIQ